MVFLAPQILSDFGSLFAYEGCPVGAWAGAVIDAANVNASEPVDERQTLQGQVARFLATPGDAWALLLPIVKLLLFVKFFIIIFIIISFLF